VRVAVGADHAGFRLKEDLKSALKEMGHDVDDVGTHSQEPADYPPICAEVARRVREGKAERGVVVGGSGQGEQIAANKVRGIRASLCNDLYTARLSRRHNDATVLALGARVVAPELALEILSLWLGTEFEGGRHQRRVAQIAAIEEEEANA
jgi:ribose 5-phosphate isomerase B